MNIIRFESYTEVVKVRISDRLMTLMFFVNSLYYETYKINGRFKNQMNHLIRGNKTLIKDT